jgi:hypothetical protein
MFLCCLKPNGDIPNKQLWACEEPMEAANMLRAIGLNRLASTVLSFNLTGSTLAKARPPRRVAAHDPSHYSHARSSRIRVACS